MKKAMLLIFGLAGLAFMPVGYLIDCNRSSTFSANIDRPLRRAADSSDVSSALKDLDGVIAYADSRRLNYGKMGKWYLSLKAERARLEAASGASELEMKNALLRLRLSIVHENKVPPNAHQFPYRDLFIGWYLLAFPISGIGLILLLHIRNH